MASRHYGANFGADVSSDVTESAGATGLNLNLEVVYDATNNGRLATLRALSIKVSA